MRSPTSALLWEVWRRQRFTIAGIAGSTVAGRVLDVAERGSGGSGDTSPLVTLLQMISFALLLGIFNQSDAGATGRLGGFPRRHFTLPVSSLQLVAVPVLAGIAAVELLYLLWLDPLSNSRSTSAWFVAVLLGATMVCCQATVWTLERLGPLRLLVMAAVVFGAFFAGLLPTFPPTPPQAWRSEASVASVTAGLAVIAFLLAWWHVSRLRSGGGRSGYRLHSLLASAPAVFSRRQKPFASRTAAHFWFEWRCSGFVLPMLVAGVLIVFIGPYSWMARDDSGRTFRLVLAALATPVVLAIPVGMAFARATFWSDDLSLPPFIAVRPLTDEEFVASKVKVAAASVAASWLVVLAFLAVWLSLWGNADAVSRLAIQWWAFHEQSIAAVYGVALLIVVAGMLLTWRLLVSRLWTGLSGRSSLFGISVVSVFAAAVGGMVFNADRLPGWVLEDPARLGGVVRAMAIAVVAKYSLAAWSWRGLSTRYTRLYLLMWGVGTTSLLALAVVSWSVVRIYVALDVYRFQAFVILLALLVVPLARVGLAPSALTRNRHR